MDLPFKALGGGKRYFLTTLQCKHIMWICVNGFSITHDNRVVLSEIGTLKMVYHRPIKGEIKTCTIHRSSTGKWYVSFSVECEPQRLPEVPTQVGIDVGLKTFATFSTGEEIAN